MSVFVRHFCGSTYWLTCQVKHDGHTNNQLVVHVQDGLSYGAVNQIQQNKGHSLPRYTEDSYCSLVFSVHSGVDGDIFGCVLDD